MTTDPTAAGGTHKWPSNAGHSAVGGRLGAEREETQPTELGPGAEGMAERLDELVEPADEPENAVLVDNARIVRWAGPAFALFSLILLPWIVYLGYSLPSRQVSPDYDVAWAGFDVILLVAVASTGYFALRRSRYLATAATATATLLVMDAWFDVTTSLPGQRLESVALAVLIELPLASVCVWLSNHTQHLVERRIVLLLRRTSAPSRTQSGHPRAVRTATSSTPSSGTASGSSRTLPCSEPMLPTITQLAQRRCGGPPSALQDDPGRAVTRMRQRGQ